MKHKYTIVLILIIIAAGVCRFYRLSSVPPGLYWDEASIGYNAYSLLQTGKDEFGKSLPLIFKAYGEYKLPTYIYAVSFSMFIFKSIEFAIRFPSALAGVISVLLTYYLVIELFNKHKQKKLVALISSFLLAISPWHLHFSRGGFEANLALFFLIFAVFLFIKAIEGKNNLLSISVIFFILSFSTYNAARIYAPLMLLSLTLIYKKDLYKLKKQFVIAFLTGFILIFSFVPQFISGKAIKRAQSVGIQQEKNPVNYFLSNYLANFDTTFLFFRGDQNGRHSVRKLGMLHVFELPLILIAMHYFCGRKFTKGSKILFTWLLLAPIPSALTKINPHALRSLNILPTWHILSAIGFVELYNKILKLKYWKQNISKVAIGIIIFYCLAFYLHRYYVIYIREAALDWSSGLKEAVEIIKNKKDNYDHIYITDHLYPIYLGLFLPVEPQYYIQLRDNGNLGKISYFKQTYEINVDKTKKNLIIAQGWQKPVTGIGYQEVKMLNRDVIFNIWEE